jgi:polyketide synthase PksM
VKKPKAPAFRSGGIYVVIGGAGGIGEVLSEYLIREYQSQVIWIGRRALDIPIQEKLDRLSVFGPAPLYMSADATDRTALAHAYREIKTRYARIHGVIHSTIVMSGNDLAHMDEAHFAAGLAAKLDVSVRMAQVFAQESVEFVLFLSSIQSFEKNARQSNYAAGCTFTDAFASRLAAEWACPVKVMNWGYWGSIGLASTYKSFQHWLAQAGMGSIEPAEGMRALEALLESSFNQLAYVKITRPQAMAAMASDERIVELSGSIYPINAVSLLERTSAVSRVGVRPTDASERSFTLDGALAKVLFSQLQSAGLFVDSQSVDSTSAMLQWKQHTQLSTVYDRWLTETIRVLGEHGYLHEVAGSITVVDSTPLDHVAVWSWWEEQKISWQADATLKAQVNLVAATLLALPEILSGKKPATDILFPNSSMDRVEGIYKNNPVSDYFNEVLAEAVVAYVEERVKLDPAARIRILEIGAGTGGTSAVVFAKLAPYQAHIEEYCYTDISKAFLMYGQERFGQEASYLTFRLFNVEQPLESQAMQAGEYDVVIAANALHATKNIRSTLRNAKATLKRCGLLVLNEFCGHSLFAHLTFGLLDGWWSYDDAAIRIPGTPGLSPESWHRVLAGEGFESIVFPAQTSHDIGQQIIVAYSNGVIRQKHLAAMSFPAPRLSERSSSLMSHPRAVGVVKSLQSEESVDAATLAEQVREVIVETLANSLKIDVAIIDADESFADYGLDSIIGVQTIEQINELLGTELTTTSVFDYSTVNKLMAHIISEYRHRLICKLTEASATQLAPATAKVMTKPIATRRFIGAAKSPGAVTEPAAAAITGEEEKIGALSQSPLRREPIAIIGMSGRYAKANSVYELWDYLASGTDLIEEVTRWDLSQHFVAATTEGNGYCGHGGFLKDIDQFDPLFFNISGIEATYMDPQQRLFLEESWKALEDAGYAGAAARVVVAACT